jgi:hypothetical protein
MQTLPVQELWIASYANGKYYLATIETEYHFGGEFEQKTEPDVDYYDLEIQQLENGDLTAVITAIPRVTLDPDDIFGRFYRCGDLRADLAAAAQ